MRRALLLTAIWCAMAPCAVAQQTTPTRDPTRTAYDLARRCFATAVGISEDPQVAPADRAAAAQRSRTTFDAGVRLGRTLGLQGQQISDDFDATSRTEAVLQMRDLAYRRQMLAQCAQLGM